MPVPSESSPPTREIHKEDLHQSDASEEPRKTTQSDTGEDRVPTGGGGWVDRFRVVLMGLICVCLVDGLIGSVCWV